MIQSYQLPQIVSVVIRGAVNKSLPTALMYSFNSSVSNLHFLIHIYWVE